MTTTSSQPEVQNLTFGTAQSTGSFTVGVSVAVSAGEITSCNRCLELNQR